MTAAGAFVDPSELLALSLDLAGSLALGAKLRDAAPSGPPAPPDAEAVQALRRELEARLGRLEAVIERRLRELPTGRSGLPGAAALHAELLARGALRARKPRAIEAVASSASDAWRLALANLLDRIRGETRSIRLELGPGISALSPASAELEAFDAALARARFRFTGQLLARIPAALGADFAARLKDAVQALPEGPEPAELDAWYACDGWIHEFQRLAQRSLRALLLHERQALLGLFEGLDELGQCASQT